MNPKELRGQAKALYDEAEILVKNNEVEKAQEKMTEADGIVAKADALEKAQKAKAALSQPTLPASLPADDSGEAAPPEPTSHAKTVYALRYGEMPNAIEQVMVDLYGKDYHATRINQSKAFNRYLRQVTREPNSEDARLLSQIVLTPEYAQKAIAEGLEIESLKSTMVEGIDSLGGYAVPVDFQQRVIQRLMGMVVMRGRAFGMSTNRDRVEMVKVTGGTDQYASAVRVTWVDETPTAGTAETNLTLGLEGIPVNTVMAETPLSRNLVEDNASNLVDILTRQFAEASAIDEDNQFLVGNGVGKPRGILPGGLNAEGLTEVVSGAAAALTFDGLVAMTFGIGSQYRQNANWVAERSTYRAIAALKDSTGQYLWRDMFGNNASEGSQSDVPLLRYPTKEQEALPTIAANSFPIIFGDMSGYTIVDRIGMTVERYLDSTTARQNLVYYIMRRRVGGQVTDPWRFAVQKVAAS